jgi:hypothetical protein
MRITLVSSWPSPPVAGLAYGTYSYMQNVQVRRCRCRPVRWSSRPPTSSWAPSAPRHLRVIQWPRDADGRLANPDEVVGRGLVMPVIQNRPILPMSWRARAPARA